MLIEGSCIWDIIIIIIMVRVKLFSEVLKVQQEKYTIFLDKVVLLALLLLLLQKGSLQRLPH